jgi:hypothetical protein
MPTDETEQERYVQTLGRSIKQNSGEKWGLTVKTGHAP